MGGGLQPGLAAQQLNHAPHLRGDPLFTMGGHRDGEGNGGADHIRSPSGCRGADRAARRTPAETKARRCISARPQCRGCSSESRKRTAAPPSQRAECRSVRRERFALYVLFSSARLCPIGPAAQFPVYLGQAGIGVLQKAFIGTAETVHAGGFVPVAAAAVAAQRVPAAGAANGRYRQ